MRPWSVGMLKVQSISLDLEALGVGGRQKGGDALPVSGLAGGAGHDHVVLGLVNAGVPGLGTVDDPLVAVPIGIGFHVGGVRAVLRLGDAEGKSAPTLCDVINPLGLLLFSAVQDHQQEAHVVADDGVLGLQIVVQAQALDGQMLADDGHAQVGAFAATVFLGRGVAVVARRVGAPAGFHHERLPFLVGQPAPLPVGAGILAAVVEEADVVVALLQRLDLPLDEVVEFLQGSPPSPVEFQNPCGPLNQAKRLIYLSGVGPAPASHRTAPAVKPEPPG